LPRANDDATTVPRASYAAAADPGGTETILLVDDNQHLTAITRRHLAALGYTVASASSGPSALTIIESGQPVDLLFTDVVMPEGMSGHQLAATARRLRPGLRVLFATGYAGGLSEPGGQHLLHKPYDRRDLARAVRAALDAMAETA